MEEFLRSRIAHVPTVAARDPAEIKHERSDRDVFGVRFGMDILTKTKVQPIALTQQAELQTYVIAVEATRDAKAKLAASAKLLEAADTRMMCAMAVIAEGGA